MSVVQLPIPPANDRSLRDEAEWLPTSVEELAKVIALVDRRYSRPQVAGMADWLVRKVMGWPDPTSSATRAKYRRILRELQPDLDADLG